MENKGYKEKVQKYLNSSMSITLKRKHIVCISLTLLVIVLLIPLVINTVFKLGFPEWISPEWSAGDLLSFYGTMLSFVGTVTLSGLALYQNHVFRIETRRIEQRQVAPVFSLEFNGCSGNYMGITAKLINISENAAKEIKIQSIVLESTTRTIKVDHCIYKPTLLGNNFCTISFSNGGIDGFACITAMMTCADRYGEFHEYEIAGKPEKSGIQFRVNERRLTKQHRLK